jgi:hypothetical protein
MMDKAMFQKNQFPESENQMQDATKLKKRETNPGLHRAIYLGHIVQNYGPVWCQGLLDAK